MRRFTVCVVLASAHASRPSTITHPNHLVMADHERGAVPVGGRCINSPSNPAGGSNPVGNHCVKLAGKFLRDFETDTEQDFGAANEWCVCLHLYTTKGKGGGDTSECSAQALANAKQMVKVDLEADLRQLERLLRRTERRVVP